MPKDPRDAQGPIRPWRGPRGERHESKPIALARAAVGRGAADAVGERRGLRAPEGRRIAIVPQPEDAELERNGEVALPSIGEDQLGRPTTDDENGHPPTGEVERAPRAQIDEVGFLLAPDDAHLDSELVAHRAHELAPVLRFAHGAGGHGLQGVGTMAIGDALESAQRVETSVEDVGRNDAAAERLPQAHKLLGAVEDVDPTVRVDVRDDEVKGIRDDVQRRDSHVEWGQSPRRLN